jgi:streptogramin lyase/mono/diheme cytochrome c family protein
MKLSYLAIALGVSVTVFAGLSGSRVGSTAAAAESDGTPGLMGKIHGADGKPLNGVDVTAQATDQTFKTTVFTDDKGEYVFPHLAAGTYKVWAQAVGFTTERVNATLDGAHTASRDFTMKTLANFENELTCADWFAALPEDTVAHKRGKQVLYVSCSGCHGLDVVLNTRFDEAGWKAIVTDMESTGYTGYSAPRNGAGGGVGGWESQIIRHHADELAQYLAEMRGPGPSPMVLKPMPRPTGDAARAVITQYDFPISQRANEMSWYNGDDWMKGESTGSHGTVGLHDVLADAAGYAWVTQSRTSFETNRSLTRLDPKTGEMKAYNFAGADGKNIRVEQIGQDTMGNFWMHDVGATSVLIRFTPATETFTAFPLPRVMAGERGMENSTDADSKGRVWINGNHGAFEFDASELNNTEVMYPGWHLYQQNTPGNGVTYGVSADADDNAWWSESYSDKVAKKDIKTGKVTEFDMRDPGYDARKALFAKDQGFYDSIGSMTWATNSAEPLPYSEMPRRLAADKHGDTVWVPNWAQSNIAEINIHTGKVTYHQFPLQVHPYMTAVAKDHNVYTSIQAGDGVYKFTPATQEWTYYQLPTHGCSPRQMGFDDIRNEAWVPCDQADTVDRIQFRSVEQIQTLKAAATSATP